MAKNARSSDMRHKVKIYEQVNVIDRTTGVIKQKWRYVFTIWCREVTIFREQLEAIYSGAETLRDRREMETRYTTKLNTTHRAVYRGDMYRISIVGDTEGIHDRTRFLMESIKDGGA